jgi:hypothetical protein
VRRISFAKTTPQVRARIKDVTRRLGWERARAGDRLAAVEKCMGFAKGTKAPPPFDVIEVVSARRERVDAITAEDVAREGFPGQTPAWFIEFFCRFAGCRPDTEITRIEFRYLGLEALLAAKVHE